MTNREWPIHRARVWLLRKAADLLEINDIAAASFANASICKHNALDDGSFRQFVAPYFRWVDVDRAVAEVYGDTPPGELDDLEAKAREDQAIAARATPLPWRWWTSNSFRRLSSDPSGKDGDVAYAFTHPDDNWPDIRICAEDMRLVERACNVLRERADAVLNLVAEVRTLRHERNELGNAIAEAAQEAGIYNSDVPLTGPQLIQLAGAVGRLCKSLSRAQPLPEERT